MRREGVGIDVGGVEFERFTIKIVDLQTESAGPGLKEVCVTKMRLGIRRDDSIGAAAGAKQRGAHFVGYLIEIATSVLKPTLGNFYLELADGLQRPFFRGNAFQAFPRLQIISGTGLRP